MACMPERVRISLVKDTADIMFLLLAFFCHVFCAVFSSGPIFHFNK